MCLIYELVEMVMYLLSIELGLWLTKFVAWYGFGNYLFVHRIPSDSFYSYVALMAL